VPVALEIAAQDGEKFTRLPDAPVDHKKNGIPEEIFEKAPPRFDIVTYALGTAVVLCALLLMALIVLRVSSRKSAAAHGRETNVASANGGKSGAQDGAAQLAGELGVSAVEPSTGKAGSATASARPNSANPAQSAGAGRPKDSPPEGSLLVFENGKEVFRMPPVGEKNATSDTGAVGHGMERASAVEPAGVIELSPEEADGSLLHRVEPEYPEKARQQKMQGAVVLDIRIGRDGSVQEVQMVSGQRLLGDAAITAVKQWRFKPQAVKGQPVEMQTRVTLNFRMPG
jgi:TonB family protein